MFLIVVKNSKVHKFRMQCKVMDQFSRTIETRKRKIRARGKNYYCSSPVGVGGVPR